MFKIKNRRRYCKYCSGEISKKRKGLFCSDLCKRGHIHLQRTGHRVIWSGEIREKQRP